MSFQISNKTVNGLEIIQLTDQAAHTIIEILPAYGAMLHAFRVQFKGKQLNLIDGYHNVEDLKNNLSSNYKSARLSPFACRIKDAKYTYRGKEYVFESKFNDGNAIHGLLFDRTFTLKTSVADDRQAKVGLNYHYRNENPGYPFEYECEVVYTLKKDNELSVHSQVKNLSGDTIPLVDGWHPYFTTGSKVNDLHLHFFAKEIVEFDERLIPTGKLLPYSKFNGGGILREEELDNSYVLDFDHKQPLCTLRDDRKGIAIEFYPDKSYPILQIYTPPHRNSIAIENISGAPDAFNNGLFLQELKPGAAAEFETTYKVRVGKE